MRINELRMVDFAYSYIRGIRMSFAYSYHGMNILTFFTPEVALLFFAFLVLFFVSISFPSTKTTLLLVVLYVWRACALALVDVAQTVGQFGSMNQKTQDLYLGAADLVVGYFLYWLFSKMGFIELRRMPWFVALVLNVLTAGLFVSSLFLLFPVESGTVLVRFGPSLFATPFMNALWLFAPLLVLGAFQVMPKRTVRKKVNVR